MDAFCELKTAFDPAGIMNPGKIVSSSPPMTENLRYGPEYSTVEIANLLRFHEGRRIGEGGGAMQWHGGMPQARFRNHVSVLHDHARGGTFDPRTSQSASRRSFGTPAARRLHHSRMFEALDLCLECKACKTECPANVDMAKLKYEFLAHYNARHGASLRARVFGNIALLSRIGSATAPVSNWLLESRIIRRSLQSALGIHPMRKLPRFARVTFQSHLRKNPPSCKPGSAPNVVLFNDTFTNYNEPWIGIAALKLLESAGARVCVPEIVCCGRPLISKGLLDQAKENARKNIALLAPLLESGCVVVGCEPSCLLTLRDEYPALVPSEEATEAGWQCSACWTSTWFNGWIPVNGSPLFPTSAGLSCSTVIAIRKAWWEQPPPSDS